MSFCLIKPLAEKFKLAVKNGEFDPSKLGEMSSSKARDYFAKFFDEGTAKQINLLYEKKSLLVNQEKAIQDFYREILGDKEFLKHKEELAKKAKERATARQEKIYNPAENEKMLNEISSDAYSKKYKIDVSLEESQTITNMASDVIESKKIAEKSPRRTKTGRPTETEMNWGRQQVDLNDYVEALKKSGDKLTWEEFKAQSKGQKTGTILKKIGTTIKNIPGTAKSLKSTFDDSFVGNQGVKLFLKGIGEATTLGFKKTPGKWGIEFGGLPSGKLWLKTFGKSFKIIWDTYGGKPVMRELRAEILSDPEIDLIKKMKVATATVEEAFPETGLERGLDWLGNKIEGKTTGALGVARKIPARIVGKTLVAADNAFTGSAYYIRYKLAKLQLDVYRKMGIDLTDTKNLESIGKQVNSITARGDTGGSQQSNGLANNIIWSPKMLKGNLDVLTAHLFDPKVSSFVKKNALSSLLKIVAGAAVITTVSNLIKPGSDEIDPRSSDFQKIKIGDRRIGYTGGAATIITLISRLVPTLHNGEWGMWTKSSTTGVFTKLNKGNFASQTGLDVFYSFLENKTAPIASVLIDYLKGVDRNDKKITLLGETSQLFAPLPLVNLTQTLDPKNKEDIAMKIIGIITEFVGFNGNLYSTSEKDWGENTGKELTAFKEKVGAIKFKQANDSYNTQYEEWLKNVKTKPVYQKLSDEDKQKLLTKKKGEIKDTIFKKYGFNYKPVKSNPLPKL